LRLQRLVQDDTAGAAGHRERSVVGGTPLTRQLLGRKSEIAA
jgi:hypothetical protein